MTHFFCISKDINFGQTKIKAFDVTKAFIFVEIKEETRVGKGRDQKQITGTLLAIKGNQESQLLYLTYNVS